MVASILIHLDFLSILPLGCYRGRLYARFNPYSPGFSIYLANHNGSGYKNLASILIHLDFLSISEIFTVPAFIFTASILIHLDFLSIL